MCEVSWCVWIVTFTDGRGDMGVGGTYKALLLFFSIA